MVECCKDCVPPKRHVGCHSTCETYLEAKRKYDEEMKVIRERKRLESDIVSTQVQSYYRRMKRKRTRKGGSY